MSHPSGILKYLLLALACASFLNFAAFAQTAAGSNGGETAGGAKSSLFVDSDDLAQLAAKISVAENSAVSIASTLPSLPADVVRAFSSGLDTGRFALVLLAAGIMVAAILAIRSAAQRHRQRAATDSVAARGAGRLFLLGLAERVVIVAIAYVFAVMVFDPASKADRIAIGFVSAFARWFVLTLLVDVILRHDRPAFRLVAIGDAAAARAARLAKTMLAALVLLTSVVPALVANGLPIPAAQSLGILTGVPVAMLAWAIADLVLPSNAAGRIAARSLVVVCWLSWTSGILFRRVAIYYALVDYFGLVVVALAIDASLALRTRNKGGVMPPGADHPWLPIMRRSIRFTAVLIIAATLAEMWLSARFNVVAPAEWDAMRRSIAVAIVVLVLGFVAYEALHYWSRRHFQDPAVLLQPGAHAQAATPASRLVSLMPLLRTLMGSVIILTAGLIAIAELGVNITPLIAGASIFGLALSFGSQSLVRDIVSGIFFLAEDAFRVGEYIDTGRLKGSVEKLSLRSLRLRHQNGQVHTIPYGQISAVTNFSRDWTTVKFNIKVVRETDLQSLRKTVKQIGQAMQEDPELGPEIIEPLKLQGIVEIQENALVCRLKFTARPVQPTLVQREAIRRIVCVFAQKGIGFPTNAAAPQASPVMAIEVTHAAAGNAGSGKEEADSSEHD